MSLWDMLTDKLDGARLTIYNWVASVQYAIKDPRDFPEMLKDKVGDLLNTVMTFLSSHSLEVAVVSIATLTTILFGYMVAFWVTSKKHTRALRYRGQLYAEVNQLVNEKRDLRIELKRVEAELIEAATSREILSGRQRDWVEAGNEMCDIINSQAKTIDELREELGDLGSSMHAVVKSRDMFEAEVIKLREELDKRKYLFNELAKQVV